MEYTIKLPAKGWRESVLISLFEFSKPLYRAIFKFRVPAWQTTMESLRCLPAHTLGKQLHDFLHNHDFGIEPKLESHDVGHVLLDYDTHVSDEVCMQFFYLGSGKKSIYSVLTTVLGFVILPEHHREFQTAFRRGLQAVNFQDWDFEHLLHEDVETLKAQIFQQKKENLLHI